MTADALFYIIIGIVTFEFLLGRWLAYLNNKRRSGELPGEMEGIYDEEKYRKSQAYHEENAQFGMITSTFSYLLLMAMLLFGGFEWVDGWVREQSNDPVPMAILFFGALYIAFDLLNLPFAIYDTFVIEEKYGFNKTTVPTFIADKLKGYLMALVLGGGLLTIFVYLYDAAGEFFWLDAWIVITAFMLVMTMFYASWIMPLFNKFKPLPDGELRQAIEDYAAKVDFDLKNIYVMDASKRSTKSNAFFSGLGKRKKIVLYDTLIEKHTTEEIVAILAHEVGHYKKKHTLQSMVISVVQTGLMLLLLSYLIESPLLPRALGIEQQSFHISLLVFSILFSPISTLIGIGMNGLSRKNEYEADAFAKSTYKPEPLMDALKKLSVNNFSNLNPHPIYVFFNYSHPPLLKRLRALKG